MKHAAAWLCTLLLAFAAWPGAAAAQAPMEGRDYVVIADGSPWRPLDGRIEVAEIFSYACHVCHEFAPMLDAWAARQPADVRVSHVPAAYRQQDPFATGYFAAEALGALDSVHAATFEAVHRRGQLARNASTREIALFQAGLGLDHDRVVAAMQSEDTRQKLNAAREFLLRSGAQGTPTVIINGRYRVQGRSLTDVLRIAEQLVARERAAGAP